MNQETTDKFFNDLIEVLFHHLSFFCPREIIREDVIEQLKDKIDVNLLDKLLILDAFNGPFYFQAEEHNMFLQKKRGYLENNIFKLIKKKEEIDEIEFSHTIDKYADQLVFYIYISNWFNVNFHKYNPTIKEFITIGAFDIQHEIFFQHFKEFNKQFGQFITIELKQSYTTLDLIKNYILDMATRYDFACEKYQIDSNSNIKNIYKIEEVEEVEEVVTDKNEKLKTNTKTKKDPLLKECEIENFLLQNVFNIKMK